MLYGYGLNQQRRQLCDKYKNNRRYDSSRRRQLPKTASFLFPIKTLILIVMIQLRNTRALLPTTNRFNSFSSCLRHDSRTWRNKRFIAQQRRYPTTFTSLASPSLRQFYKGCNLHRGAVVSLSTKSSKMDYTDFLSNDDDTTTSTKTVQQVLHSAIQELQDAKVEEAEDSVYQLLAKVLDLSWENGYRELRDIHQTTLSRTAATSPLANQCLSNDQQDLLAAFLTRRKAHEPVQYLLGQWDFLDYTFAVCPPLLCPRPETEELVLCAAEPYASKKPADSDDSALSSHLRSIRILDVGCGTGCIGISLADRLSGAKVTALDVEPKAVETALQNARKILGTDYSNRYKAHLISAEEFDIESSDERFDLVVSNPPYIPANDMSTLGAVVSKWESHTALCGGPDGMDVIRTIIHKLKHWCQPGADCWMEVDPTHPALLQEWLAKEGETLGVAFVESRADFQGLDRLVHLRVL